MDTSIIILRQFLEEIKYNFWFAAESGDLYEEGFDWMRMLMVFCLEGYRQTVHTPELDISGQLRFGPLLPLKYDIMGPFCVLPFLECRHSVQSMRHTVSGKMLVNGQMYLFRNASGYWEGDQGRSRFD
ncbi:MAG: hypothetical protein K1W22_04295 [Lachnospiraceae bacterium]